MKEQQKKHDLELEKLKQEILNFKSTPGAGGSGSSGSSDSGGCGLGSDCDNSRGSDSFSLAYGSDFGNGRVLFLFVNSFWFASDVISVSAA